MLQKRIGESLTARIFLITFLIMLCAGGVTFAFIACAAPSMYTSVVNSELQKQTDELVRRLENTKLADSGAVIDEFIRNTRADVMVIDENGGVAETGSELAKRREDGGSVTVSFNGTKDGTAEALEVSADEENGEITTVTTMEQYAVIAEASFADAADGYTLYVTPHAEEQNLAVRALIRTVPWLLPVLLALSLLCAFFYSRYITRPIVRMSAAAKRMAELDFGSKCGGGRRDEIGTLGRSLNSLSERLSAALGELETANLALRGEVEREREAERRRTAFFAAASHELKTPVTILKGQLTGMLEGVDVYRDRDKYLLRSLRVMGRMEELIREMLDVSRMDSGAVTPAREPVDLAELLKSRLTAAGELISQRGQSAELRAERTGTVTGDASLLSKAVGNLLSNASMYSPRGAVIRVWCGTLCGAPAFTIENSGAHIDNDALPRIFEAFYREEPSRSRSTGGSGLGLYIVRMILERHNARCIVKNTDDGVRAEVRFDAG